MTVTPSASYSLTLRVEIEHTPGRLGELTSAIGNAGGNIGSIDIVRLDDDRLVRDLTVNARDQEHWRAILIAVKETDGVELLEFTDRTLEHHRGGKIEIRNKIPLKSRDDLSMAYTPGVARVCEVVRDEPDAVYKYTIKSNTVAVVTDGTAVLGLGDIGPEAALPVMEGKAMLFKEFANVDAYPICLASTDPDEIVAAIKMIAPTFGGINLEDISSPRCFQIERRLQEELDIPVFHDDQHGTAIVVLAALLNALRLTEKPIEDVNVVISGLGASAIAVTKILLHSGVNRVIGCDRRGAIHTERDDWDEMSPIKQWYAGVTNPERRCGPPADVLEGADLFIGLSGPGVLPAAALKKMNDNAIVFAMANPSPEVMPEEAAPYVRVMATGRSDYPNQINNVLAFPGVFRGALDARAPTITEKMKLAAARGIAAVVKDDELSEDYIIPSVFNRDVATAVAKAVADEARKESGANPKGT